MKPSPKKHIKLNKIKPSNSNNPINSLNHINCLNQINCLNPTTISFSKDSQPDLIPRSLAPPIDFKEPSTFSLKEPQTGSSQKLTLQLRTFQTKPFEQEKTKKLKFELKCHDYRCDDDSQTLISYGGYSVQSIVSKKEPAIHNHRKMNQITQYDYLEDEVPEILSELFQHEKDKEIEGSKDKPFPYPKGGKTNWKLSPFAPIFFNKNPQIQSTSMHRHVENEENRQKKEIEKWDLEREIEAVKKKFEQDEKNKLTKNQPKLEDKKATPDKEKRRTRLMEKEEALSGFEVSQKAEPGNQGRYCYPCRVKFDDYWGHIQLLEHKNACKLSLGNDFFEGEVGFVKEGREREMGMSEFKELEEMERFLREVVENVEAITMKKGVETKERLRMVNGAVEEWARR